jgi:hypothetical protein
VGRNFKAGYFLNKGGVAFAVIQINVISASGKGAGSVFRMVNIQTFFSVQ